MPLTTNFNVDPYYDDFDENKNFHRTLFKPGTAVQSRELTQIQTNLQDQIKKFGDHIFKNGSVVTGGQILIQNCNYLNIQSTFGGSLISANVFNQQDIVNSANTKRAHVLKSYSSVESKGEPLTLIITQSYGDPFEAGEEIRTINSNPTVVSYYAKTADNDPVGESVSYSIDTGVFYYDGYFIKTQPQSVALSKYNRQVNTIVGFAVNEEIVDYSQDTSLLDPAQSSSNYQAPGADRYKIALNLETRDLDTTDLSKFIELAQFENGKPKKVIYDPQYSAILKELARRTSDESGDYIIDDFSIYLEDSSTDRSKMNVTLGGGKAYVKGYNFETSYPTTFTIDKPRTTISVSNHRIPSDYGYYIYANNYFGNFATNQYGVATLLLIDSGQIPFSGTRAANTTLLANVTIGSARVKLAKFYSVVNDSTDTTNYIYKLYLTDINTTPIFANNGWGVNLSGTGTATTMILPGQASMNSSVYIGCEIIVPQGQAWTTGGTLITDASVYTPRKIIAYDATTRTATVDPAFTTTGTSLPNANWRITIRPSFGDLESIIVANSAGQILANANVNPISKSSDRRDYTTWLTTSKSTFQPTSVSERGREPLLLKVGENFVADNTIKDFSFSYQKLYQNVLLNASGVSPVLGVASGETLQDVNVNGAKSDALVKEHYRVVVADGPTTSTYQRGTTIPTSALTIDATARTITVSSGASLTCNIFATINSDNPGSKTKTYIRANTQFRSPTGGGTNSIFGSVASGNTDVYVSITDGQTVVGNNFIGYAGARRPGVPISLFVSDVHSINAIFDFNGVAFANGLTETHFADLTSSANVTNRYFFDNGQKDSYYDWASIRLKPGETSPKGPLLIRYNKFKSTGSGYFDVDSYTRLGPWQEGGSGVDYGDIPTFKSQDGLIYKLADYFDFRPVRVDAGSLYLTDKFSSNTYLLDADEANIGNKIAEPGLDILTDYGYYLPRIDRIILTSDREFKIVKGNPGVVPVTPVEPANAMTIYLLKMAPWLQDPTSQVNIDIFNNKRYTMRDIAKLDRRLTNLEIYTSLSIAELSTLAKYDYTIKDRPKNGFFTDTFANFNSADYLNSDFKVSFDRISKLMRGQYDQEDISLVPAQEYFNDFVNTDLYGTVLMLDSTATTFIEQNKASTAVNVNPFNVVNYLGKVRLFPNQDIPDSLVRLEKLNVDLTGGDAAKAAWGEIKIRNWGDWDVDLIQDVDVDVETGIKENVGEAYWQGNKLVQDTTTYDQTSVTVSTTFNASRTGEEVQIGGRTVTQSLGDRVVDYSVIHYMRENNILFTIDQFKPETPLNMFFDNDNVTEKYIDALNQFIFEDRDSHAENIIKDDATFQAWAASEGLTPVKSGTTWEKWIAFVKENLPPETEFIAQASPEEIRSSGFEYKAIVEKAKNADGTIDVWSGALTNPPSPFVASAYGSSTIGEFVSSLTYDIGYGKQEFVTVSDVTDNTLLTKADTNSKLFGQVLAVQESTDTLWCVFKWTPTPTGDGGRDAFRKNGTEIATNIYSWEKFATKGFWIIGKNSGAKYRATKWRHQSGWAQGGSATTVILSPWAGGAVNAGDFVGQTITILNGLNGQTGKTGVITAYDPATLTATVSGFGGTAIDNTCRYNIGKVKTDKFGVSAGIFECPDGVYRTGEKLFRVIDSDVNDVTNSRTNGDAFFYAYIAKQTKQETAVSVMVPEVVGRTVVTEEMSASSVATGSDRSNEVAGQDVLAYRDPVAQTFLVDPKEFPQGIIMDSVRVCFRTKDISESITCEIRPTEGQGKPSSVKIYPYGTKTLKPNQVNVTEIPNLRDKSKYTEFKFDVPVNLLPGEHSFVFLSNSTGYEIYVAEMNGTDLRTSTSISEQPYSGSFFKSQNGSTWTPDQNIDIMFSLQKRVFNVGEIGYGYFYAQMTNPATGAVRERFAFDLFHVKANEAIPNNTAVEYDFVSEDEAGNRHTLLPFNANKDYICSDDGYGRRVLNPVTGDETYVLRITMQTQNKDISPMIDTNSLLMHAIANRINNMPLVVSGFKIINPGSGYTVGSTPALTITNKNSGSGTATGYGVVAADGTISSIVLTNAGSGYIDSPTVTIAAPGSGTTAIIEYNGEDKAGGGNAEVRYISKKVQLVNAFDAGDLRVYVDLHRPPGTGIVVYYKVLSDSDPSRFEDNNWNIMTELTDTLSYYSANRNEFFEATFAPGIWNSGVPANAINYKPANAINDSDTRKDFGMFQIKIVLYGENPVAVPKVGNLRVIALPDRTLVGSTTSGTTNKAAVG